VRLELDARGIQKAGRHIHGAADRAADLRPAFQRVADEWLDSEKRQFESGKGWKKLAKSTRERKVRQATFWQGTMRESGALERALTVRRARGSDDPRRSASSWLSASTRIRTEQGLLRSSFHQKGQGRPQAQGRRVRQAGAAAGQPDRARLHRPRL
jgi:hypothetical protein